MSFWKNVEEAYKRRNIQKQIKAKENPVGTAILGFTGVGLAGWVVYKAFIELDSICIALVLFTLAKIIYFRG